MNWLGCSMKLGSSMVMSITSSFSLSPETLRIVAHAYGKSTSVSETKTRNGGLGDVPRALTRD